MILFPPPSLHPIQSACEAFCFQLCALAASPVSWLSYCNSLQISFPFLLLLSRQQAERSFFSFSYHHCYLIFYNGTFKIYMKVEGWVYLLSFNFNYQFITSLVVSSAHSPQSFGTTTDIISPNQLIWNCPKVKFWLGTYWFIQKTPCLHCRGHRFNPWLGNLLQFAPSLPPQKS